MVRTLTLRDTTSKRICQTLVLAGNMPFNFPKQKKPLGLGVATSISTTATIRVLIYTNTLGSCHIQLTSTLVGQLLRMVQFLAIVHIQRKFKQYNLDL